MAVDAKPLPGHLAGSFESSASPVRPAYPAEHDGPHLVQLCCNRALFVNVAKSASATRRATKLSITMLDLLFCSICESVLDKLRLPCCFCLVLGGAGSGWLPWAKINGCQRAVRGKDVICGRLRPLATKVAVQCCKFIGPLCSHEASCASSCAILRWRLTRSTRRSSMTRRI